MKGKQKFDKADVKRLFSYLRNLFKVNAKYGKSIMGKKTVVFCRI